MKRRDFLKTGVYGGAAGLVAAGTSAGSAEAAPNPPDALAPAVLRSYTAEDHRRRMESIRFCREGIRSCLRQHLITDYLPAQATYNFGEYPAKTPWEIGEYDEQELDRLRDHGIQIIQVFDDWNDSIRLFGGDKYSSVNPKGFRRFIELCHARGIKVLPYISTGFIQQTDPDFRQEWSREGEILTLGFWNMARCSPASAGWRAFVLPKIMQVLDEYGADGLYNDGGYLANFHNLKKGPTTDEVAAFEESAESDGAFTDLLSLIYAEVKRRGGIVKLHVNGAEKPMSRGAKVYDYLWVGEGVGNLDAMRDRVKGYAPYLVPCPDITFAKVEAKDEAYLQAIPYMQFPILQAGKPFTGERAMIPGVEYSKNPDDFWMKLCREAWEYYQAHPEGPYSYGAWDYIPGRADIRPTHAQWLKRYLPMVEDGTTAWLEVKDSPLFVEPLPANTVASFFANREVYLVLANYGTEPIEVATRDKYVATNAPDGPSQQRWRIAGRALEILRLQG
ncbi:MAG: alpha-amylase family protein [FCB group bacterium]|jgi:hypothetical protein|nr:alpha-amylase family protein [FCB group bacterium]